MAERAVEALELIAGSLERLAEVAEINAGALKEELEARVRAEQRDLRG